MREEVPNIEEGGADLLEDLERLEQLRLIEAGYTVATFLVEGTSLSVDTADQLEQARQIASAGSLVS